MLDLVEIATASFRTDDSSERQGDNQLRERFGLDARYAVARLAIARSLALDDAPPAAPTLDSRVIKGDVLFGVDLATWVTLLIERSTAVTLKELQAAVGAHWRRGIGLLQADLVAAGSDEATFWTDLARNAGLPLEGGGGSAGPAADPEVAARGVVLTIGEVGTDIDTGEAVAWPMNASGSPHFAFMGGSGQGKTSTVVQMLKQLRTQTPAPILAFDMKGDLAREFGLDRSFGARVLAPPHDAVPLDVFAVPPTADTTGIKLAAGRFRDCFTRLKTDRLGARQSAALTEALETMLGALRRQRPATLVDVKAALERIYKKREMKPDGASALVEELAGYRLFAPDMSPGEFFAHSWIISMPSSTPETLRRLVVNLLLDSLDRWLNGLPDAPITAGNRAIRHVVMLDEAHLVLQTKLPALGNLVRLSRSKGGVIALLSQSPDDFTSEDDDFLANMGLVATFNTNASDTPVRRVFGRKLDLAGLAPGVCAVRFGGGAARLVQSFRPVRLG